MEEAASTKPLQLIYQSTRRHWQNTEVYNSTAHRTSYLTSKILYGSILGKNHYLTTFLKLHELGLVECS
jgi:hypothetical protein